MADTSCYSCLYSLLFTCSLALHHCASGLIATENVYQHALKTFGKEVFFSSSFQLACDPFLIFSLSSLHSDSGATKRETEPMRSCVFLAPESAHTPSPFRLNLCPIGLTRTTLNTLQRSPMHTIRPVSRHRTLPKLPFLFLLNSRHRTNPTH